MTDYNKGWLTGWFVGLLMAAVGIVAGFLGFFDWFTR